MTDKITITKKHLAASLKYFTQDTSVIGAIWDALVLESQKREPIERWAVYKGDFYVGSYGSSYGSREDVEKFYDEGKEYRIVLLREVEGE